MYKLRSFTDRTRDHKREKDVADLFSLMWYGGVSLGSLRLKVLDVLDPIFVGETMGRISRDDIENAAKVLDIDSRQIIRGPY